MKVIIWIGVISLCELIQIAAILHRGFTRAPYDSAVALLSDSAGFFAAKLLCLLWDEHKNGSVRNKYRDRKDSENV